MSNKKNQTQPLLGTYNRGEGGYDLRFAHTSVDKQEVQSNRIYRGKPYKVRTTLEKFELTTKVSARYFEA